MRKLSFLMIASGLLISCHGKSTSPGDGSFIIRVIDEMNMPLAEATVWGGFDWTWFSVTTTVDGFAVLPEYALNVSATISKNNFISRGVDRLRSEEYALTRAPLELDKIGDIEGEAAIFAGNRISTVTYQGRYRSYSFDDNGVTELAEDSLAHTITDYKMSGDTLWLTAFDDGIYAYSLTDPLHPRRMLHVEIPGYLWPFARRDSLIAVGDRYNPGPIRLYKFDSSGNADLLGSAGSLVATDIRFISHYLVAVGRWPATASVFDIGDPTDIALVYDVNYGENSGAIIHGDSVILGLGNLNIDTYQYVMLDLSDPANPVEIYTFSAQGTIENIVQDSLAVGSYYNDLYSRAIFKRTNLGAFELLATISQLWALPGFGGCLPPYFITNSSLYKLVPWEN